MSLTPFRGRCHTCGHDHDAEDERLRDLMSICDDAKRRAIATEADATVAQLRAALEPFTQFNSSDEFITAKLRTADITRAREALAQQTKEPSNG